MHSAEIFPAIHSGDFYTPGAKRVIARLSTMGIAIPKEALAFPLRKGPGKSLSEFTRIEHAMLDWFEGRDYEQAQALIHYRPPRNEWQIIRILDHDKCPSGTTPSMLCPTRTDAIAAVLHACDDDLMRLDACRRDGADIIVTIGGTDVLRIEPLPLEPFDLAARNRVRTAFKGVRQYDSRITSRAARLPGFADCFRDAPAPRPSPEPYGCLLIGFPSNWALAMRGALKQVDIEVTQSQAQELVALFFGASNWHQLVRHQDDLNYACEPVSLSYETSDGRRERFYRSTEEAIFGLGNVLKSFPEAIVCIEFHLSPNLRRVNFLGAARREVEAADYVRTFDSQDRIECAMNDYWSLDVEDCPSYAAAAQQILQDLDHDHQRSPTVELLYDGDDGAALLEGMLKRNGLPAHHLVYLGDHALAVFHVPNPTGGPLQAAKARIYRMKDHGPKHIADVAMYKAQVTVDRMVGGYRIAIEPDYGRGARIEILRADDEQLQHFLELTQADNLFKSCTPEIRTSAPRRRNFEM